MYREPERQQHQESYWKKKYICTFNLLISLKSVNLEIAITQNKSSQSSEEKKNYSHLEFLLS